MSVCTCDVIDVIIMSFSEFGTVVMGMECQLLLICGCGFDSHLDMDVTLKCTNLHIPGRDLPDGHEVNPTIIISPTPPYILN